MRRRRALCLSGLVGLTSAPAALGDAFMPSLAFNWTIDDLDAQLDWLPDDYPNTTRSSYAWSTTFDNTTSPYVPGMVGVGSSSHSASAVNVTQSNDYIGPNTPYGPNVPTLHFRFLGTAVYIYGSAQAPNNNWTIPPLTLGVDQQETDISHPAVNGLLASRDDLPWGYHVVSLFLNFGNVTVDKVVVTTGMKTKA